MVHAQFVPAASDIWRIPGRRSSVADRKPEELIASRWNDEEPAYSPDGRRIAFSSDRSGTPSVWVSDEDGANPIQLTVFDSLIGGGVFGGAPWSPDGRRIVVISQEAGNWDLYLVDSEGGRPQRLTHEPSADVAGSFSRDGRFIYFSSDRSGRSQIWKMPAAGGPAVQVTRGGGLGAEESWDARSVYYSNDTGGGEIWRVPVEGGEETPVVRALDTLKGWELSRGGIYYATARDLEGTHTEYTIRFLDFESGRTETLLRKEGPAWQWSLRVSPDEKWILFGETPSPQSELMLVENFR
jgi:Tol biopolymer transport system component